MVSGSPDVSNSFVSPYSNSFLPVWLVVSGSPDVSNSFVSPYSNSFVSQSGWSLIAIHLSPNLAGGVRLSGCLQIHFSSLTAIHFSQSGWWCPALRMSPIHLSPLYSSSFLPVWLVVSGSPDVSNSFVSPYSNSLVSQSGWWCPALRMSPIYLSPLTAIHLSPSLAGGVRLSGCLQFIRLRLQQVSLVVSGSLQFSNSYISPSSNAFVSHSCW